MAALGDEALLATLEADGEAVAAGEGRAFDDGAVAELVERAGWAKVAVVSADEREQGGATGRISLNLGHTVAHALETADGYTTLLHGEAVAYGLRAACRIGVALGVTPPDRAARIEPGCWTAWSWAPRRSPTRSIPCWRRRGPTRSTPAAGCAGSCRRPTATSCGTTCRTM